MQAMQAGTHVSTDLVASVHVFPMGRCMTPGKQRLCENDIQVRAICQVHTTRALNFPSCCGTTAEPVPLCHTNFCHRCGARREEQPGRKDVGVSHLSQSVRPPFQQRTKRQFKGLGWWMLPIVKLTKFLCEWSGKWSHVFSVVMGLSW